MLLKGLQGKVHRQQNREAALLINKKIYIYISRGPA